MPVLVKFSGNYADEFNCETFEIFETEEAYNEALSRLRTLVQKYFSTHNELEVYFGTNEQLTFDSEAEVFRSFKRFDIEETTYSELSSIFDLNISYRDHFGTGTSIADMVGRLADYDEEDYE